jgi:regulator of protease activity HflC (stomatin/prohibitin superfamily)
MRTNGSFPALIFIVIAGIGAVLGFSLHATGYDYLAFAVFGIAIFVGAITSSAIRVADQWSKAVVLRLGKFRALQGPGLFFIIPLIDTIPYWIDVIGKTMLSDMLEGRDKISAVLQTIIDARTQP